MVYINLDVCPGANVWLTGSEDIQCSPYDCYVLNRRSVVSNQTCHNWFHRLSLIITDEQTDTDESPLNRIQLHVLIEYSTYGCIGTKSMRFTSAKPLPSRRTTRH